MYVCMYVCIYMPTMLSKRGWQGIAKRGHYGSFLMDDWDLIYKLINTLHSEFDAGVFVNS